MREPCGEVSASPAALPAAALWLALPGLILLPFVAWQSLIAGLVFALGWAGLDLLAVRRVAGTRVRWDEHFITFSTGIRFHTRRCLPCAALTGADRYSGPLLRHAGCCLVVLRAPGTGAVAFGLSHADADRLCGLLTER